MKDIHPELLKRKIIHVDMDAFFAAVEILDNPALKGLPLVIGGSPQSRSVVCTASYEARKFGIRSAMPCSKAYRLCPDAIFIKPRHERYQEVSRQIYKIFTRYASKIEPISLDEAYLDVTEETSSSQCTNTYASTEKEGASQTAATHEQSSLPLKEYSIDNPLSMAHADLAYQKNFDESLTDGYLVQLDDNRQLCGFNGEDSLQKPTINHELATEGKALNSGLTRNHVGQKNDCEAQWQTDSIRLTKKLTTATAIAKAIKADILAEIGLTASAGVAPNKMLAKLASDFEKPNGLTVIKPSEVSRFMHTLAVKKIHGIGPVSAQKLESIGIFTCADIYRFRKMDLYEKVGARFAEWLWDHGMGISRSQVSRDHERKSLGSENTFREDILDLASLRSELKTIAADVFRRMKKRRLISSHLTLKIKYSDFSVQTRSTQIPTPFTSEDQILSYAFLLLKKGIAKPVRLLGISLTHLEEQLSDCIPFQAPLMFDPENSNFL